MITSDDKLHLLESFVQDRNLPKFQRAMDDRDAKAEDGDEMMSAEQFERTVRRSSGRIRFASSGLLVSGGRRQPVFDDEESLGPLTKTSIPWYRRVLLSMLGIKVASVSGAVSLPGPAEPTITIEQFFASLKNSAEELVLVEQRLDGYRRALLDAEQTGQTALCERIAVDIEAVRAETQLHAIGLSRYLSEETVVRFYKESPKGLRLDWVANFLRVIPASVRETKVRCDELGIFDNYAVLHYDPETKAFAETQAELLARQDPILFGLVEGRRRLYFVGDWIDETCDLTLEQIADRLGKDSVETLSAEWSR